MLERVPGLPAAELDLDSYLADYHREFAQAQGVFYKLERGQTFREPGDPSWEAFIAGDWHRALELNEQDRAEARAMVRRHREQGLAAYRLRVVQEPVSAYVQWEMHFLRLLAEEGQPIAVLRAEQIAARERDRPLPEIVLLGEHVLYQVRYDAEGTPCGARRIDEPGTVAACRADLARLFAAGEPLLDFFHREIAPLPAPASA